MLVSILNIHVQCRAAYRNLGQGGQTETTEHFSGVYALRVFKLSAKKQY